MNRFLNWLWSRRESFRRRKLQLQVSTPDPVSPDPLAYLVMLLSRRPTRGERALAAYLDYCEGDQLVAEVMKTEQLSRSDLEEIYRRLLANGLDRWVKGHHPALSSIAYADPLIFVSRARNKGMEWKRIANALLEYWNGNLSDQELREYVK